jgi:hypothetical protein
MKKVKVTRNIWGSFNAFIGSERVDMFGSEFDANEWLSELLATGKYELSDKSDITMGAIEKHSTTCDRTYAAATSKRNN